MGTKPDGRKKRGKYNEWLEEDGLLKLQAWARDGHTDEQIAELIGISRRTLYDWKNKFAPISHALKRGKEVVDIEVENSLLKRAMGYSYEEEKTYIQEVDGKVTKRKEITTKHIPSDTTAMIFWLKNRKPEAWRDRKDIDMSMDVNTEEKSKEYQKYLKDDAE